MAEAAKSYVENLHFLAEIHMVLNKALVPGKAEDVVEVKLTKHQIGTLMVLVEEIIG